MKNPAGDGGAVAEVASFGGPQRIREGPSGHSSPKGEHHDRHRLLCTARSHNEHTNKP